MAKPPVNDLMRRRAASYGTIRPAQPSLEQFYNDFKGWTANRAHQGLEQIRQPQSVMERSLDAAGIPATGARQAMGLLTTALSPVGGLGETIGHRAYPNPGDPRAARLGDVAEMATPIPLEKAADALKLTRAGFNVLMRPRVAKAAAQVAEQAMPVTPDLSRRGFLLGSAAAGAGAVAAAHMAPALLKGLPEAAEAVIPSTHAMAAGAHKAAEGLWDHVLNLAATKAPASDIAAAQQAAQQATENAKSLTHKIYGDSIEDPHQEGVEDILGSGIKGRSTEDVASAMAESHALQVESHVMDENIREIEDTYGPQAAADANIGWGQGESGDIASKVYHPDGPVIVQSFYDPYTGEIVHQHSDYEGIGHFEEQADQIVAAARGGPISPSDMPEGLTIQQQRDWKPGS